MKLKILTVTAAIALAGCTATDEMISAQLDRCTKLGYTPGTPEHAQCAERGTMQQQQAQNAAVAGTGTAIATGIIYDALFY